MKRLIVASFGAILMTLTPALPVHASVKWVCDVPGEGEVTFVTAADAAQHGIWPANAKAGTVFHTQFGETCTVVSS